MIHIASTSTRWFCVKITRRLIAFESSRRENSRLWSRLVASFSVVRWFLPVKFNTEFQDSNERWTRRPWMKRYPHRVLVREATKGGARNWSGVAPIKTILGESWPGAETDSYACRSCTRHDFAIEGRTFAGTRRSAPKHVRQLQRPFWKVEGFYPTIVIYTCCLLIVSLSGGNWQPTTYVLGTESTAAGNCHRREEI